MDVASAMASWRKSHRDYVVGGNEAGMILEGDVRGADAAVWRRETVPRLEGKYMRVPPILAVEVQGELEDEAMMRAKARWYTARGVEVVWLVLTSERRVIVVDAAGERSFAMGEHVASRASLPDLAPAVAELFEQIGEA